MIVEDDIRIADINRRFTEKVEGFKVIGTATTGEQAKEWLDLVKPQLVLLDVYLPDMQGTELVT
nr:response regulator [Streptococcus oralis]